MTILSHKGYQGSVTFDGDALLVQVLHIADAVMDRCDAAKDAQATFEHLVDDYLETCAAVGKDPDKPFRDSFNIRIHPSLHRRAAQAAAERGMSLNQWIGQAIEREIDREQGEGSPPRVRAAS